MPDAIAAQVAALEGPLPQVPIGDHCFEPHECPFMKRCWPEWPADHVSTLYVMRRRALDLEAKGYRTLHDLPGDLKLNAIQVRQVRAVQAGTLVVEESLAEALVPFQGPLAFLDFETVSPAIPVWNGCRPWDQVPVQFSVHVQQRGGGYAHHEWLAEGGADPRPAQAERLVAACAEAHAIVAYNSSFERSCVRLLAAAAPGLARELGLIELKLVDLLPVVRNHVYHPQFAGSFSLKSVIPALVPEVTYDDLEIRDGAAATLALWRLVFEPEGQSPRERVAKRRALLAYCERDSWATVKLLERLRVLAGGLPVAAPRPTATPPGRAAAGSGIVGRLFRPFQVHTLPRVNPHPVTFGDEIRNLHGDAIGQLGGLGARGFRGTAHDGRRFDHIELDHRGQLDRDRATIEPFDLHDHLRLEPGARVQHRVVVERMLVVVLPVHHMDAAGVAVQDLELLGVEPGFLHKVGGVEARVEGVPVEQIAEPHLDERAQIAGGAVGEVHHPARLAVDDEDVPLADIGCLHGR